MALAGIEVDDNLSAIAHIIPNEYQARALTPLAKRDPVVARAVWKDVSEKYGGNVTAEKIRDEVQRREGRADALYH